MNSRVLAVFAVVLVAICASVIWFLNEQPPPAAITAPTVEPLPPTTPKVARFTPPKRTESVDEDNSAPTTPEPEPLAEWEVKINQVLGVNADESATAQMLINLFPTLPPDGQAEAAQHITNLVLDKDYGRVLPLVKNPNLPEEVLDVLVSDLMNREDEVKLPALLEIAKLPNHPHHEEAATDLEIFLDEDNGQDWAKWERTMKEYLKKQAVENAAAETEDNDLPSPNALRSAPR